MGCELAGLGDQRVPEAAVTLGDLDPFLEAATVRRERLAGPGSLEEANPIGRELGDQVSGVTIHRDEEGPINAQTCQAHHRRALGTGRQMLLCKLPEQPLIRAAHRTTPASCRLVSLFMSTNLSS